MTAITVKALRDQLSECVEAGQGEMPVLAGGLIGITQVSSPGDDHDPEVWLDLEGDITIDDNGRADPDDLTREVRIKAAEQRDAE